MNKEQQIEEIEQFIYDYVDSKQTEKVYLCSSHVNELAKPFVHNKGIAEALYNAGYRKTFTSDTQKAYKEGYIKGIEETEAEMERLKAQLSEFEKPVTQFVKDRETQAVKEFAEELKKKVHNYYPSIDSYCTSRHVILVKDIDELLKENDNETT